MKKTELDSHESQLQLEAMLYLLEDPALDRDAFEARLLDDPQLGEILANAVGLFHRLQSVEFNSTPVAAVSETLLASNELKSAQGGLFGLALAASVLIACSIGWQAFELTKANQSNSPLNTSLNNVVLAWGDLQSESESLKPDQENSDGELVAPMNVSDTFAESEVPDWLVLAAANIFDSNDAVDGKVFLQ